MAYPNQPNGGEVRSLASLFARTASPYEVILLQ